MWGSTCLRSALGDLTAVDRVPRTLGWRLPAGTGVGKGREIASTILDNWCQRRHRHIWCSISTSLLFDCQRDLSDLGRPDVSARTLCAMSSARVPFVFCMARVRGCRSLFTLCTSCPMASCRRRSKKG